MENAFKKSLYRKALELARAAEALAHVSKHPVNQLPGGKERKKLSASL